MSNLQRQILHSERTVGMLKTESAAQAIKQYVINIWRTTSLISWHCRLNSRVKVDVTTEALSPSNAVALLNNYDVILDCTDNAPTRYLISDTAVFLGKPLVSGAAQMYRGQLCTYNLGENGLCYRCLFPTPPPLEMTGNCEQVGILGVVTGVIGNLQALEAIKIITGLHSAAFIESKNGLSSHIPEGNEPSILVFSALGTPPFRRVELGSRISTCPACGDDGQKIGEIKDIDYVQFCGGQVPDWEKQGLVDDPRLRIHAKARNYRHLMLTHIEELCILGIPTLNGGTR
jgi:adenylyltransferase/sulfurtransferase